MNKTQIGDVEHALRNGNLFYAEVDDDNWNDLVQKGYATKHPGWDRSMAYFRVTNEGKRELNEFFKQPPYSKEEYEGAKKQGLDLDDWNDYVEYWGLGEEPNYDDM